MKRNRNSFFTETNTQTMMQQPPMSQGMPGAGANMPYQASNSYFYSGPNLPNNYNTPTNDIESRLAKIERQINRIDHRLTKLENNANTYTTEDFDSTSTNMYMV